MHSRTDIEITFSDPQGPLEAYHIAQAVTYVFFMNKGHFLPFDNMRPVNADGWVHYPERYMKQEKIRAFQELRKQYRIIYTRLTQSRGADDPQYKEYYEMAKELTGHMRQDGLRFVFEDCEGMKHNRQIENLYYDDFFSMLCFMLAATSPEISFEGMRRIAVPGSFVKKILTHTVYDGRVLTFEMMEGDPAYGFGTVSWTRTEDTFEKHTRGFPFISVYILTDDYEGLKKDEDLDRWICGINDVQMEMAAANLDYVRASYIPYPRVMIHAPSREKCVRYRDELLAVLSSKGYQTKMFSILYREECAGSPAVIPDSATKIGDQVFGGRSDIKSIVIPDNITAIGESAFEKCISLEEMHLPDSVTEIDKYAFWLCKGLKTVTLPKQLQKLAAGLFCGCSGLEDITIPDSVIEIDNYVFSGCANIKSITIPAGVRKIGDKVFDGCKSLLSVVIYDGVSEIGKDVFKDCASGLTICGIKGSEAERYAAGNGIAFMGL